MKARYLAATLFALAAMACDKDPSANATATSAAVTASAPSTASAAPSASLAAATSAAPSASAPAAASSTSMITGADTDDVMLTEKDPTKEPEKSVKAKTGGAFTLFLPDAQGNVWAADSAGSLGKPKEEVIPGFAPQTLGHQFKWTSLKAGKTTLTFGMRKSGTKGGAPMQTFKLTLDVG